MGYKIRGTKVISPYPAKLTPGEMRLVFGLEKVFAPERIFADCYFPKVDQKKNLCRVATKSDLVQVDCIVIDESGVYVFESKDYIGWIYAHGERAYWTQVSGYGKSKHQFYSPVKQNAAHVAAISEMVGGEEVPIFSVIVFGREATLKVVEGLPEQCIVCTQGEMRQIMEKMKQRAVIESEKVKQIAEIIRQGLVNPDGIVRTGHIAEVEEIVRKKL